MAVIAFKKTGYLASGLLPSNFDYICWYAKDKARLKYRQVHVSKLETLAFVGQDLWIDLPNGERRRLTPDETARLSELSGLGRVFRHKLAESSGASGNTDPFEFNGKIFRPKGGKHWSTTPEGMQRLANANRFVVMGNSLRYVNYLDDFPVSPLTSVWTDTVVSGFSDPQLYVVQTSNKVVERCILMTTDPGDLVVDPTCGSGTTAYVAEQWGRRWITIDCSRVPLALARQRLLTATFPDYQLLDEKAGVSGGFKYERQQNKKGEEIGGIVPHVTLKSIAHNEPPDEEVLVDRPNETKGIVRVTGTFVVEATIPTPANGNGEAREDKTTDYGLFVERMLEALRRSPVLRLPNNQSVTFKNVRQPAKTLSLNAEAEIVTKTLEDLGEEADTQKSLEIKAVCWLRLYSGRRTAQ